VDTGPFAFKESMMAKTRLPYAPEFRRQMVELVHAGRSPKELAREFEPTAQSIRNWLAESECNAGRSDGGLTTAEREELNRLRRENRQLRLEREILSKAAAWFARENEHDPYEGFRFVSDHHRAAIPRRDMPRSGIRPLSDRHDVSAAGCLLQRLPCVGEAAAIAAVADRRRADHGDPCRAYVYRPRFLGHRSKPYAALAAG
jgi:transposase